MKARLVLVLALAGVVLGTAPVDAASTDPQDVATRVAQEIMSPFCPGLTLHDCPSDAAADLRDRIVEMASAGASESEIIAELEREYGPGIRAVPESTSFGLLAWMVPLIFVIAGIGVVLFAARRLSRSRIPEGEEPISPAEREQVAREVAMLRDERRPLMDPTKRRALEAIMELEDDLTTGKLSAADLEGLRVRYEAEALRALKRLESLRIPQNIGGAEGGPSGRALDEQLEAEIAEIRATMVCETCGDVKRADGTCPTCSAP
ncbi:MAG TPA: cytochrome c-type biogenesis protein CcmH [Actinomycetota bacterium]|nr:cytochrome c-type biogenesis protein CcmH [Actinomycetota bacterium]